MAPLADVAAWAAYLPPESATARSIDPHWQRSLEVDLLREVEFDLRVLAWQQTVDGSKGRNVPDRLRLPWDAPPEGAMSGAPMEWDDAADWFGWRDEMDQWFDERR